MKILIEIDVKIDPKYGDVLSDTEIKKEIEEHLNDFMNPDEDDLPKRFGSIAVPSERCWDCYTFIDFDSIKVLQ